jgi:hypothetical protein
VLHQPYCRIWASGLNECGSRVRTLCIGFSQDRSTVHLPTLMYTHHHLPFFPPSLLTIAACFWRILLLLESSHNDLFRPFHSFSHPCFTSLWVFLQFSSKELWNYNSECCRCLCLAQGAFKV